MMTAMKMTTRASQVREGRAERVVNRVRADKVVATEEDDRRPEVDGRKVTTTRVTRKRTTKVKRLRKGGVSRVRAGEVAATADNVAKQAVSNRKAMTMRATKMAMTPR
jgi:hypothetical protein